MHGPEGPILVFYYSSSALRGVFYLIMAWRKKNKMKKTKAPSRRNLTSTSFPGPAQAFISFICWAEAGPGSGSHRRALRPVPELELGWNRRFFSFLFIFIERKVRFQVRDFISAPIKVPPLSLYFYFMVAEPCARRK